MNLEQKIRRGFAFVFLSALGGRLLAFGADIGLMRLLAVEAHGALAFGLLVVNTVALLRSLGVGEALIFRREADRDACDTGFFLSLGLGLGCYGLIWAGAPWIALLAEEGAAAELVDLLRVLGLLIPLQALASVPGALLDRELEFEKKLYVDLLPTLVYALLALGLALAGHGVWSMVWGRLGSGLAGALAAFWFSPWRPRWRFSWASARQLAGYGRFVAAASLVSFLVVNVDDALVVRLTGIESLGFYARAYLLANLPATAITHIAGRVAFPAYARLEGRPEAVAALYAGLVGAVALLTLPVACGLLLLAEPLSLGLFGPRWGPLAPLLPWLAVYGFLRSLLSNSGPLFNATGRPQSILKTNLLQLAILGAALYPLIEGWGAMGACAGILLGTLLSAPLALRYVRHAAGLSIPQQLAQLRPLWLPGAGMAATMLLLRRLLEAGWPTVPPLALLLLCGAAGLAAYAALVWWRERPALARAVALVQGKIDG